MALSDFQKKLFTHVSVAVGIVALLFLFLFLLNKDIAARAERIEVSKGEVALRMKTIELLTGANSDLKRAEPLLANLQTFLPNKDQLINFPRELQRAAKVYAVDVGFTFGAERPALPQVPGGIKFTMTISGTYDNVVDFLRTVEEHKYIVSLDSVDVQRSAKDTFSLLTSGEIFIR
jgi:Tfp pilus assembly protein PilO